MSDIEILEIIGPTSIKRNRKDKVFTGKRKRTSSGLIEKSSTMKGTETEFEEFVIDRTITPQRKVTVKDVEKSGAGSECRSASRWRQQLESTFLGSLTTPKSLENQKAVQYRKSCFNCDGEHNMRDCTRPRNFRKIARKKTESGYEPRPYNAGGISKQKEKKFKPGKMSNDLRDALGLQTHDIPEHVYRMRRLGFVKGYPPGWLRKAIKSTDLIKVYCTDSTNSREEYLIKPPELDISKIVGYPGFNEEDLKLNDLELFKVPPINTFCSGYQNELEKMFKKQKKATKKKSRTLAKHTKFSDDDDDVIVLETEKTKNETEKFKTPREESAVVLLKGDLEEETLETPTRKTVEMGQSMLELRGTPIYGKATTPAASLEAFAVGIQPFRAGSEEIGRKGTFRKLMSKLDEIRAKNPANVQVHGVPDTQDDTSSKACDSSEKTNTKKRRKNRKECH